MSDETPTAVPSWDTPAHIAIALTNVIAVAAWVMAYIVHAPFDRSALAALVPTASLAFAFLVNAVYVHGFHRVAAARAHADASVRSSIAYAASKSTPEV